ncbi:MAG: class I SAM-dependent methyltransferase [Candidatus Krumholzibacteria bacterium]|nr:class I SAM-dependent methyltransferase [Candidatus Krumholzibacteria bacterium]
MTHRHIGAVLNTEITKRSLGSPLRILDMGCGNGYLIAYLQRELSRERTGIEPEMYGFDVDDSAVQDPAFFAETLRFLAGEFSSIDWSTRLATLKTSDEWPYPDGFFDFVVSNQVMEHVRDHDLAFAQIRRVLKDSGISVHLFPLKYVLYETHLNLPCVHWISNSDLLVSYIKGCSRIGLGNFKSHRLRSGNTLTLDEYAAKHADYMTYETNYLSMRQLYELAKRHRMRCSFRYTGGFYTNKLRSILGSPLRREYAPHTSAFVERLGLFLYALVASVTVVLEKDNLYIR